MCSAHPSSNITQLVFHGTAHGIYDTLRHAHQPEMLHFLCVQHVMFQFYFSYFHTYKMMLYKRGTCKRARKNGNNMCFCLEGLNSNSRFMGCELGMAWPNAAHIDLYHPYFLCI